MRRITGNVLLVLLSSLLAIGLAEFLSGRVGLPPGFGRVHPLDGAPTREVDGVVLWDHAQPRVDDVAQSAPPDGDAFVVLGLGDSIMYGVGLAVEQTYFEHARRALAEQGRDVRLFNLATPGFNTMQENAAHEEIAERLNPDVVIVHYWEDDARQYRVFDGQVVDFGDMDRDGELIQALPLPRAVNEFLLLHSRVYRLLTYFLVTSGREAAPSDWSRVAAPLEEIAHRTARSGGRLVVLASPGLDRAKPTPNSDLFSLRKLAERHGFELIDLAEWLDGVDSSTVAMDACHLNAEGHRILGDRLARYLLTRDLLEPEGAAP